MSTRTNPNKTTPSTRHSVQVESPLDKHRVIPATTTVMLQGLVQKPHLNGRVAICMGYQATKQRYAIQLKETWTDPDEPDTEKSHQLCLRRENFVVLRRAEGSKCMDLHATCRGCDKSFGLDYIQKCAKCKVVQYCSKACQKQHWFAKHKRVCSTVRTTRKATDLLPSMGKPEDRRMAREFRIERYRNEGKYVKAEKEIRLLLQEFAVEEDAVYWFQISQCLCGQDRHEEAIGALQRVVGVPRSESEKDIVAFSYKIYGVLLQSIKNDIEGARGAYRAGLKLQPDDDILKMELRKLLRELPGPSRGPRYEVYNFE